MSATLNMFDLIFISATLVIILIAFFRGFVRELFSLINWIIAVALVFLISPFLSKLILKYTDSVIVANIASSSILFIVIFIISSLATRKFASALKEKIPMTTDQVLGVLYGFIKSFLIFGFVYSATINLHSSIYNVSSKSRAKSSMPNWLYESKFRSVISPVGKVLDPITRSFLSTSQEQFLGKKTIKPKKKSINQIIRQEDDGEPFSIFGTSKKKRYIKEEPMRVYDKAYEKKSKKDDEKYEEMGYSKKEIEKMNHLIEIVE